MGGDPAALGRRLHERVVHEALHDPLTGLPNRLLFKERLEQAMARPLRRRLAVLLLGLDRFRAVNDAHGHSAGDEFAVLAELEDEAEAATLAQRLLDRGFVASAAGERGRRIIEAALSIGRAADLGVVAEGVETDEQLTLLRECGCRFVQGYLLGRPAPPEQVRIGVRGLD